MFIMFKIAYIILMAAHVVCDYIALQTYSELPPVLRSVHHPPSECFVSFYDVGVFAFPLVES
jgi:hypothetical protein